MLIECEECGSTVSSLSDRCPECGFPLAMADKPPEDGSILHRIERLSFGIYGEPLRWVISSIRADGGALLIASDRIIERKPFSELGKWLSSEFPYEAFSTQQRAYIAGAPFCMTAEQATLLFPTDDSRRAWPNASAHRGMPSEASYAYWLSTPAADDVRFQYVNRQGVIVDAGEYPEFELGVRPALWLDPTGSQPIAFGKTGNPPAPE